MGRKRDFQLPSSHTKAGFRSLGRVLGTSVVVAAPLTGARCGHKLREAASTAWHHRGTWPRAMQRHPEGMEQQHHCTSWINTGSSGLSRAMSEELPPEEGRDDKLHQGDELWPPPVTAASLGWRGAVGLCMAAQLAEPALPPLARLIAASGVVSHPTC